MRSEDRDKFKRLAERRVNNVIKTIRLIGNLSNKSNYDYTDNDIDKIFSALNAEIKAARARFTSSDGNEKREFTLD